MEFGGCVAGHRCWQHSHEGYWEYLVRKGLLEECQITRYEGQTFRVIQVVFLYEKNFLIIFTANPRMLNVSSNAKKQQVICHTYLCEIAMQFKRLKINKFKSRLWFFFFSFHKDFSILCSEKLFTVQFLICSWLYILCRKHYVLKECRRQCLV